MVALRTCATANNICDHPVVTSPGKEAAELTKMVQAFAKIIETSELEERVRKLEEAIDK
jgi:hypothetical protein